MRNLLNLPNKMRYISLVLILLIACQPKQQDESSKSDWAIVIHGGAGNMDPATFSIERQNEYKIKLEEAIKVGSNILESGGTSLEAVEASIHILENSPLFNAGKGAVFNANGQNEMDASIMDGFSGKAGAVAGVRHVKNPISAAISVMEKSPHVLLIGEGAEDFVEQNEVELIDTSWFYTERRWKSYEKMKENKHGTVGCVALDKHGNIVAGTSTGGMTMKMPGRVGDSPIIGAGTFADNNTCGISATGHGEFFIRNVVAYDVAAIMKYQGKSIDEAAQYVIHDKLKSQNAEGGIIGLDASGNIIMEFNTTGMFRAWNKSGSSLASEIFK